jgi:molybdate transport system substrate-binding protein
LPAMTRRALAVLTPLVLALFVACKKSPAASDPIRVAAASDLTLAFEEVSQVFEREAGKKVSFSFGSTGLLARQIREGAPFDLFAAANVSFVDDVIRAGACDESSKAFYARGRIAIWSKSGGRARPPESLSELSDRRFVRIAIANPEHAPYGAAAREALRRAGIWETLAPRMVYGENVRQALQFAESGNAEVAIVAYSLAIVEKGGSFQLIEESRHQPIDQALVVCSRGSNREGGRAFAQFLSGKAGRSIMKRYGFVLPGEVAGQP